MKLKNLSYKVGDEAFPANRVLRVEMDGVHTLIEYSEELENGCCHIRTIKCRTYEVEVIVE